MSVIAYRFNLEPPFEIPAYGPESNDVSGISMDDITNWIGIGKHRAQKLLEELGMDTLLKVNNHWNQVSAGINAVENKTNRRTHCIGVRYQDFYFDIISIRYWGKYRNFDTIFDNL